MAQFRSLVFLCLILTTLSACKEPSATNDSAIEGHWLTACIDAGDGTSYQRDLVVTDADFTFTHQVFLDDVTCQSLSYTLTTRGTYRSTIRGISNSGGYYRINLSYLSGSALPANANGAASMNAFTECGLTTWSEGILKDVTGKTCGLLPVRAVGQIDYNIFGVSSTSGPPVLRFGDESNGYSGDYDGARPYELETYDAYVKQN